MTQEKPYPTRGRVWVALDDLKLSGPLKPEKWIHFFAGAGTDVETGQPLSEDEAKVGRMLLKMVNENEGPGIERVDFTLTEDDPGEYGGELFVPRRVTWQ